MRWYEDEHVVSVSSLVGVTLTAVERTVQPDENYGAGNDMLVFRSGETEWRLYHRRDCCETVSIDDIVGDLSDLVGTPVLLAEESVSNEPPAWHNGARGESETWTFYRFATIKGDVSIRWYGESNGYYSEAVDFVKVPAGEVADG